MLYRIARSLANRGILGTARLSVSHVGRWLGNLTGSRPQPADTAERSDLDRLFGVETDGSYTPGKNDVRGDNWKHGGRYQGVDALLFTRTFDGLNIAYPEFTFVDLGSGKGRALLLAARYPFSRIIGVEYSQSLHQIAQQNVARCPENVKQCRQIQTLCLDAAEFEFPPGPLVLFLYNPFWPPVMEKVIENVGASLRLSPRRIIVTYFNPQHAALWERAGFVAPILHSEVIAVYDSDRQTTRAV